jgi:hypothetical protein
VDWRRDAVLAAIALEVKSANHHPRWSDLNGRCCHCWRMNRADGTGMMPIASVLMEVGSLDYCCYQQAYE